ncbi:MAG: transcriptional regulator, MerR family [Firmicutes bacterium]|nr:transcriptional regulator, MerR family [Bacillota bacterium]
MFRIGDFSKIAKVSIRMLRHYDQIGLLKPAYIEATSGYRSYSINQLPQLNRIIFLKDIGFSLNEISELIDDNISLEEMKRMLLKRQKDLENEISMAQLNLSSVMERLRTIENEREIPLYDITVKSAESYSVAAFRNIVPHVREMCIYCYNMYSKLYEELNKLKISTIGPEITFYYNEEYSETDLDMEVSIVIAGNLVEIDKIKESELTFKKISSQEKVASLIYSGSYEGVEGAIIELLKWIGSNNWEVMGELREIHFSGPAHVDGIVQEHAVIELQIPIKGY